MNNGYYHIVRCFRMVALVTVVSAIAYLVGCGGVSKPTEGSLIEAFGYDVTNYGWSLRAERVNYEISDGDRYILGFEKKGDKEWCKGETGKGQATITLTKLEIIENESDRFPYKGTVSGQEKTIWGGNNQTETSSFQITYYYGKKTSKWIREETVTP